MNAVTNDKFNREYVEALDGFAPDERVAELAAAILAVDRRLKELPLARQLTHQVQWFVDALSLQDDVAACRALDQVCETVRKLKELPR